MGRTAPAAGSPLSAHCQHPYGQCIRVRGPAPGGQEAGFESREAVFDRAWEKGILHRTDLYLRRRALEKFTQFKHAPGRKLFYNLDSRVTASADYTGGRTAAMLKALGLQSHDICFELSEQQRSGREQGISDCLEAYRAQGYKISVDDFGIVRDNQYMGILTTNSLLKIINEKNLSQARNQNPLTKLPGNTLIHEYFSTSLADRTSSYLLVYFDFDHFKPFNDTYGFPQQLPGARTLGEAPLV